MKITLLTLLVVLFIAFTSAQSNCRAYSPSGTECKVHKTENCLDGVVVWPYPQSTCKFPILVEKNQKKIQVMARSSPISWKIEDLKGKIIEEGNGFLNKTLSFSKSKGVNVFLTYPSRVNLFQMTLSWKFIKETKEVKLSK